CLADLNEALRLNPGYAWAFARRGDLYFNLRNFDQAISDYREAIRLDPENINHRHSLTYFEEFVAKNPTEFQRVGQGPVNQRATPAPAPASQPAPVEQPIQGYTKHC